MCEARGVVVVGCLMNKSQRIWKGVSDPFALFGGLVEEIMNIQNPSRRIKLLVVKTDLK